MAGERSADSTTDDNIDLLDAGSHRYSLASNYDSTSNVHYPYTILSAVDGLTGTVSPINGLGGAINIHDADVHGSVVNRYIHQHTGTITTLTADSNAGDYQLVVASTAGFSVGDPVHINTTTIESTHPIITAIVGSTLTLDRQLESPHLIGDSVEVAITNMATQIGTMATPEIYYVGPPAGEVWHITRILFELTHGTAGDLGLFGDQPALTNGVVLRSYIDGVYHVFTNWKDNSDMKVDMYDVEFDPRSGGGGSYGTTGRGTFKKAGVVVRLDGDSGDELQVMVQDDLTGLVSFTMKAQGHQESF